MNTGNRYEGRSGVLKLADPEGSPAEVAHVIGFVATETVAELDGNEQGSKYTDRDEGRWTMEVAVDVFRGKGSALLRAQSYELELEYDDDTTPGSITGTFLCTAIPTTYRLDGNVAYSLTLKNQGAYVVTNPAGL